jgi:signal transduction histidine kinase
MESPEHGRPEEALANAIRSSTHDILTEWQALVIREMPPRDIDPREFLDAMGEFLGGVADSLAGEAPPQEEGSTVWHAAASEHGVARVRQGFDIQELVREFAVLRRVLVRRAQQAQLLKDEALRERLLELFDGAVAASVKSYVDSRDYAARRTEAEHIGFITHELKTPLNAAVLAAGQLRRNLPQDPSIQRPLDLLDRSHRRLEKLIGDVLLVEKLEATRKANPAEITLGDLLRDVLHDAEAASSAKGLAFEVAIDAGVLLSVDEGLARSAIQNVVENAVKYTDRGAVRVSSDVDSGEVKLHVWDNCPGLSPEELGIIFLPFKRGRSGKSGSGLGLAIAKRAIEACHGTIQVESSAGAGCHFWLTLPRARH